jgi:hypothetical protein
MSLKLNVLNRSGSNFDQLLAQLLQICPAIRPYICHFGHPLRSSDSFALTHASLVYTAVHQATTENQLRGSRFNADNGLLGVYYHENLSILIQEQAAVFTINLWWNIDEDSNQYQAMIEQAAHHGWKHQLNDSL